MGWTAECGSPSGGPWHNPVLPCCLGRQVCFSWQLNTFQNTGTRAPIPTGTSTVAILCFSFLVSGAVGFPSPVQSGGLARPVLGEQSPEIWGTPFISGPGPQKPHCRARHALRGDRLMTHDQPGEMRVNLAPEWWGMKAPGFLCVVQEAPGLKNSWKEAALYPFTLGLTSSARVILPGPPQTLVSLCPSVSWEGVPRMRGGDREHLRSDPSPSPGPPLRAVSLPQLPGPNLSPTTPSPSVLRPPLSAPTCPRSGPRPLPRGGCSGPSATLRRT